MWVLGLTGGIGSGKSAAGHYFRQQGMKVVDADVVAREVVEPHQPAWLAIRARYGDEALLDSLELNRAWLRAKIFSDEQERSWLESQTHPRIRERIIAQLQQAQSAYAVLESPLLYESGQVLLTQRSLLIDVPESVQLERACQRDNNDPEQIRRIIRAQMNRSERQQHADDIVENSGSLEQLHQQLATLHQRYLQLAQDYAR